jgi:hypothetical protein
VEQLQGGAGMRAICIDYETHFSDEYSLSRMSTENYVRDPRFKAHGAAIRWSATTEPVWYDESRLRYVLSQEDWSDTLIFAWHCNFDGLILTHHYGVKPKMWGCPMSMARLLHPIHQSVALDAIRKLYGMPAKITPYSIFKGKQWDELTKREQEMIGEGACDEVNSIWTLFKKFVSQMPIEELDVIDSLVSMFVDPVLQADTGMLADLWESEAKAKQERMKALGITEADVQSAAKFQALLEAEGVEIGYKENPKGELIPAFSKSDDFMQELLEHDDDRIRTLAEARIGAKSTLLQTRAETLGNMANRGPLCVYLRYCGAATLRPTGGDGANWLNFKRGSAIRRSILAPKGYLLGPVDASQIEFRFAMKLAGQDDVVERLRRGEDPYIPLACEFYGEEIYKPGKDDPRKLEMEQKRGCSKQANLMCLGPNTLVLTNNGIKPITEVSTDDLLWDGCEWVEHLGLISQGVKRVVKRKGVFMTPDHLVLCGSMWQPASRVRGSIQSLASETGSANLPSQAMNWPSEAALNLLLPSVRAARPNTLWTRITCSPAKARVVWRARERLRDSTEKNSWVMWMFVRIKNTVIACSLELQRFILDAVQAANITRSPIMVDAGLKFMRRGYLTKERSSPIWSRSKVGIVLNYRSIESTIIKDTCREIYGSLIEKLKQLTVADFAIWRKSLPTYDLVCSGPRNRFTVVTAAGFFIVHNCIYGAAAKQFQKTAKAGLYGPPVDMSLEEADRFVTIFRDSHPAVCAPNTGYWAQCGRIISRLAGGPPMDWGPFLVKDHKLILPSGQAMLYDTLEFHRPDVGEDCRDFERNGYWRMKVKRGWKKMWPSKLCQNIMEFVSRVHVSQAMIRIKRQYGIRSLNWPYDELLLLIPDNSKAEETLELCRLEMCRTPSWLPGLPLDAEASLGSRYSK